MNHRFTHAAETVQVIRERLKSREWWIWIPVGATGAQELQKIERAFYWDDANSDFDLAFFPSRLLFVALGRKTRATPEQLLAVMAPTVEVKLTYDTDVMVLIAEDDEAGKVRALESLGSLLTSYFPDMN